MSSVGIFLGAWMFVFGWGIFATRFIIASEDFTRANKWWGLRMMTFGALIIGLSVWEKLP